MDAALSLVPSTPSQPSTPPESSEIKRRGLDGYIGKHTSDLDAVRAVATPSATEHFHPIPHVDLYERVRAELTLCGIGVTEELHALYGRGSRYIGLAVTDLKSTDGDAEVVVGWFNAHDRSAAAHVLLGEQVMVCFNLCLHAEVKVVRRHTRWIERDLPGLVAQAVRSVRGRVSDHGRRMDGYRRTALNDRDGSHVLIQLVERRALSAGQLTGVLGEWREPSHDVFATSWNVNRLYQAITAHPAPLSDMARRHRVVHEVLDGWCEERSAR